MKTSLRKSGNSRGVVIPKAIIKQLGIEGDLDMTVEDSAIVLRVPPKRVDRNGAALAAIKFAVTTHDANAFLHHWLLRDVETIRREWPDAPKAVFVGMAPVKASKEVL